MYNKYEDVALYINYIPIYEGSKDGPFYYTYEIYSPKYRFDFESKNDNMLSFNEIKKVLKSVEYYENNLAFDFFEENNVELPTSEYIEELPEYIEKIEKLKKQYDYYFNAKDIGLL